MKLYKGYLYYIDEVDPSYSYTLHRVNIKTKKRTKILKAITTDMQYAIVKSKLYVTYHDTLNDKYVRKVMKLNGKSKKNTKIKVCTTDYDLYFPTSGDW